MVWIDYVRLKIIMEAKNVEVDISLKGDCTSSPMLKFLERELTPALLCQQSTSLSANKNVACQVSLCYPKLKDFLRRSEV